MASTAASMMRGSIACSLAVSGDDVCAGGFVYDSSFTSHGGYWKNGDWVGLTNPVDTAIEMRIMSVTVVAK
jgi:hypothetical protein